MHDYGIFEYIYQYPNEIKQRVFTQIISQITHGHVLDLGCGKAGLYWSLGYIQRVEQVAFFDYWADNCAFLQTSLNELSAGQLEKDYHRVASFLQTRQLLHPSCSFEELAEEIVTRMGDIRSFDFLTDMVQDRYDFILCLQSLECVSDTTELEQAIAQIHTMLHPGGTCLGTVLRYHSRTDFTEQLIAVKLDGQLNPPAELLEAAFRRNSFSQVALQNISIPESSYNEMLLFTARRDKA